MVILLCNFNAVSKMHVMKRGYIYSRQGSFAAMLSLGLASQDSPQEGEEAHLVLASF